MSLANVWLASLCSVPSYRASGIVQGKVDSLILPAFMELSGDLCHFPLMKKMLDLQNNIFTIFPN